MKIFALALLLAAASPALAQTDASPSAAQPTATIETAQGDIVIALDRAHAPVTVDNFIRYAREGHFDGTIIYRVVPGFVIQMGSYMPDGSAKPTHDPIALEANNGLKNVKGAVAMARTDPNSATAEFFIDMDDIPSLDATPGDTANTTGYAVFGHVVSGMDAVEKIASAPLGGQGPFGPDASPMNPVVIERVTVSEASP
ncbi:MAG TPA: peptidylprolyl isomerase [Rhizomicrobium sp.]|jgi:peptidyl-prolyl cis-trans isomerase A (cyclophilin A)|nr:peptidylprolyl isomerase [Rhizomicrobium sp.]